MANGFGKPEDTGEKTDWSFLSLSNHSFRMKRQLRETFTAEGVRAVVLGRNSGRRLWRSLAELFFDGEEHGDVWRSLFKGKFQEFDRMGPRAARMKYIEHARETLGLEADSRARRREFQRWGGLPNAELKALLGRKVDMPGPEVQETSGREKQADIESNRLRQAEHEAARAIMDKESLLREKERQQEIAREELEQSRQRDHDPIVEARLWSDLEKGKALDDSREKVEGSGRKNLAGRPEAKRDQTRPSVRTAKARETEEEAKLLGPRSGSVTQSFSHGRKKNVVVETKRKRVVVPKPGASSPATTKKSTTFNQSKRPAGISDAEIERRVKALAAAKARETEEMAKLLGLRSGSEKQSFADAPDKTAVVEGKMSRQAAAKARLNATHAISNSPHKPEEARPINDQQKETVWKMDRQDPRKVRQSSGPLDMSEWRKELLDREEFDPNPFRDWPDEEEIGPEIEEVEDEEEDGQ